ncbi:MAG: hypothetical protein ACXV74_02650 [Methylobacter sp.]
MADRGYHVHIDGFQQHLHDVNLLLDEFTKNGRRAKLTKIVSGYSKEWDQHLLTKEDHHFDDKDFDFYATISAESYDDLKGIHNFILKRFHDSYGIKVDSELTLAAADFPEKGSIEIPSIVIDKLREGHIVEYHFSISSSQSVPVELEELHQKCMDSCQDSWLLTELSDGRSRYISTCVIPSEKKVAALAKELHSLYKLASSMLSGYDAKIMFEEVIFVDRA